MLILVHGLGGHGGVWDGVKELVASAGLGELVLTPDLAGHGRAARLGAYTNAAWADGIGASIDAVGGADEIRIIGHSLGGVVALELARRRPDLPITAVAAFGAKTTWTDEEIAGVVRVADKGAAHFDTEAEACARFVRVSGLSGLVDPDSDQARAGVCQTATGWTLAADPEVYRMTRFDFGSILGDVRCRVVLGRGSGDEMAPAGDLGAFGLPVRTLEGVGHNAHLEDPALVLSLLDAD